MTGALLLAIALSATPARGKAVKPPAPPPAQAATPDRPVSVTAKSLEVTPNSRQAVWKDDVVAERDDFRLSCDRLTADYDDAKRIRQLTCSGNVHLVQKGEPPREAWGDEAVFVTATNSVALTGSPRAREGANEMIGSKVTFFVGENRILVDRPELQAEEAGRKMRITARSLDIPRDSNLAVWKGDVVAERDDFTLSCRSLTAEYGEPSRVRRLVCSRDVHLVQKKPVNGPREGWGDRAVFDNLKSTVEITGNPRAREGESNMKGSRVTYLIEEKRLRVDNPVMVLDTRQAGGKGGLR